MNSLNSGEKLNFTAVITAVTLLLLLDIHFKLIGLQMEIYIYI